MRFWIIACALLALPFAGCNRSSDVVGNASSQSAVNATANATLTAYCGTCGHGVTGEVNDHQCDTVHATCENCPFHKGAELCCKGVQDTAGKFYCVSCGDEVGSGTCCQKDVEICDNCPFPKGSALCLQFEDHAAAESASD